MSNFIFVDVESDGPCPGLYSMVSFGAVVYSNNPNEEVISFHGKTAPISDIWIPEALAISNISREEHLTYPHPDVVMNSFLIWLNKVVLRDRPIFVSDNLAFDWQFINYYFHRFEGKNPFGFSGRRIGDIYSGAVKDLRKSSEWKKFRKTKHDHNPVNDALGNVEAFRKIKQICNIK